MSLFMTIMLQLTIVLGLLTALCAVLQWRGGPILGATSDGGIELVDAEIVSDAEMHQLRFGHNRRLDGGAHRLLADASKDSGDRNAAQSALARANWEQSLKVLRA